MGTRVNVLPPGRWVPYNRLRHDVGMIPMWEMGYEYLFDEPHVVLRNGSAPRPLDHPGACRQALSTVRRETWTRREQALRGQKWEGYG